MKKKTNGEVKIINPQIPKNVCESIEYAMMQQGVDKIEDLKWTIIFKKLSRKEFERMYPEY